MPIAPTSFDSYFIDVSLTERLSRLVHVRSPPGFDGYGARQLALHLERCMYDAFAEQTDGAVDGAD